MTAPASFPLFPSDLLVGTSLFTNHELGAYVRLLCYNWSHGSLPFDMDKLRKLAGDEIPPCVMKKFKIGSDGQLRNERMEKERFKLTQAMRVLPADSTPLPALQNGALEAFCVREGIAKLLQRDGFPDVWREYRAYRVERNEPLTSQSARHLMLKCERMGAKESVKTIKTAMLKSWKNPLEPHEMSGYGKTATAEPPPKPKPSQLQTQIDDVKRVLDDWPTMSESEKTIARNFLRTLTDASLQVWFSESQRELIESILK